MRAMFLLLPLTCVLGGCFWSADGFDNYDVRVVNHTDDDILVSYDEGMSDGSIEWSEGAGTWIGPHGSTHIHVKDLMWDADIDVLYRGMLQTYDVDPDFWGDDTIDVWPGDFAPAMPRAVAN